MRCRSYARRIRLADHKPCTDCKPADADASLRATQTVE
jgi:hypothetical protein